MCQRELMIAGEPYPRTCPLCGLFGKCHKGLPNPLGKPAFDTEEARLRDALEEATIKCRLASTYYYTADEWCEVVKAVDALLEHRKGKEKK